LRLGFDPSFLILYLTADEEALFPSNRHTGGAGLVLMGCETRSISDSGYRGHAWDTGNRYYRGELNEADVLGPPAGQKITEAEIRKALTTARSVRVHPGDSLLVVQPGAIAPDGAMVDALTRLGYHVQGFSGVPPADGERADYSRKLRLAAAQGGLTHILCYWATLESTREGQVTKPCRQSKRRRFTTKPRNRASPIDNIIS